MQYTFPRRACLVFLLLTTGSVQAMDISGTIASTLTITDNSRLVGDVSCANTTGPCIQFGADGISIKLNGFTMVGGGNGGPPSDGISTAGQSNVSIEGPGSMQFFTTAVVVLGTNNKVTGIVAVNNGTFGMLVNGSGNILEGNTLAGNGGSGGIGPNGQAQGAQLAISGNANQLLRNELATQQSENDVTNIAIDGDRNILEENNTSGGDPAEVVIFTVHTGNVLRRNSILGGIFSHTTPILDNNAPGSNTYESNLCFFPSVGPSPAPCPGFPGLSGHMNATSTPLSPSQQISNLIALLNSFHVGPSGQSLLNKLLDIQDKIMKGRLGSVCNDLAAFIREVMAQSGKSLTAAQANQLIAAVNQLGTTLGC